MTSPLSRRALLRTSLGAGISAVALVSLSAPALAAGTSGILLLAHGVHAMPKTHNPGHDHSDPKTQQTDARPRHGYFQGGHAAHMPEPAKAEFMTVANATTHPEAAANPWHDNIETIARALNKTIPTEIAFGMAEPAAMQAAVDRLEKRGVTHITAIPLFVSSHSPIIGNFRYILRLQDKLGTRTQLKQLDRIQSKATFTFTGAMDADPLISEILYDRAKSVAKDPAKTNIVLIAHGPNDEEDNKLWLKDMEQHAAYLKQKGFRAVEVLTHRNDASPEIKSAARTAFRARVEAAGRDGETVVVPLLLSRGGIEVEVQGDLDGLKFKFAAPLAPHPNLQRWVEARFQAASAT